jgi:hypothetical protein
MASNVTRSAIFIDQPHQLSKRARFGSLADKPLVYEPEVLGGEVGTGRFLGPEVHLIRARAFTLTN